MKEIKRNDIYYAELDPVVGSEQGGLRPVLILQNDTGNRHSPTTIVAAITSSPRKTNLPTHIKPFRRIMNVKVSASSGPRLYREMT